MKFLIIIGVLAVLLFLIYLRLRPLIRMLRQMFSVTRQFRQAVREEQAAPATRAGGEGDMLIRCAACETWVPSSRAIKLRSGNASYCSHACLESRAEVSPRKATG